MWEQVVDNSYKWWRILLASFYSTRFFATTLNWTLSMYKEKEITERKHQAGSSGSLLEKDTVTPGGQFCRTDTRYAPKGSRHKDEGQWCWTFWQDGMCDSASVRVCVGTIFISFYTRKHFFFFTFKIFKNFIYNCWIYNVLTQISPRANSPHARNSQIHDFCFNFCIVLHTHHKLMISTSTFLYSYICLYPVQSI